jgi:hypothetical protein
MSWYGVSSIFTPSWFHSLVFRIGYDERLRPGLSHAQQSLMMLMKLFSKMILPWRSKKQHLSPPKTSRSAMNILASLEYIEWREFGYKRAD